MIRDGDVGDFSVFACWLDFFLSFYKINQEKRIDFLIDLFLRGKKQTEPTNHKHDQNGFDTDLLHYNYPTL